MAGFLAYIIPMDTGNAPTHPIAPGGQPPYPSQGPGFPTHPIAPGGQPPYPDQGLPGQQPGVSHPIAPGGQPPQPSHPIVIPPGALGDGKPTHPIVIPPEVTHPIVIPPGSIAPGVPTHPITLPPPQPGQPTHPIAPGGSGGQPTHPIVLPPVPPPEESTKALVFVKTAGQDGVWFILDKDSNLKPTHPQPKPGG